MTQIIIPVPVSREVIPMTEAMTPITTMAKTVHVVVIRVITALGREDPIITADPADQVDPEDPAEMRAADFENIEELCMKNSFYET